MAGIYESVVSSGKIPIGKNALLGWLDQNCWVRRTGIYVPISDTLTLLAKLPLGCGTVAASIHPFQNQYFSNSLLIPSDYDSEGFNPCCTASPTLRAANSGRIVVTYEFDCRTIEEFEETLSWSRMCGADKSPLKQIDLELRRFKDYRGYSLVFSGGKSLHHHFIFSSEHLLKVPGNATAAERLAGNWKEDAALMHQVHGQYWDITWEIFERTVLPPIEPDKALRSYIEWRRAPWGLRRLEKDSVLGIPAGTAVPQLVVAEDVLTRASRGSTGFGVPATFSLADPIRSTRRASGGNRAHQTATAAMIEEARAICRAEWGPYPALQTITQDAGIWVWRFTNHAGDTNPSTVVLGDHRKLLVKGEGHSISGDRYLPDGLSAQELGDHLALSFNVRPSSKRARTDQTSDPERSGPYTFADLKELSVTPVESARQRIERSFPEPITDLSVDSLQAKYRHKIASAAKEVRVFGAPVVIRSGEGIGKTTVHIPILLNEAFDEALSHNDSRARFAALACRSRAQTQQKAEELRSNGYQVAVVIPFRDCYEEVCRALKVTPIGRNDFDEFKPGAVLRQIQEQQPIVSSALEEIRRSIWAGQTRFDGGTTILVLTHKAATLWHVTHLTRAWYHPDFKLDEPEKFEELAEELVLGRVVFDDPEPDDFVYVLPSLLYLQIQELQTQFPGWSHRGRRQRIEAFSSSASGIAGGLASDFEQFDDQMRLDLKTLTRIAVDFNAIPFGNDQNASGIYRQKHQAVYYIGPKPWLSSTSAHMTFLTTEAVVTRLIEVALRKSPRVHRPFELELTDLPGIYPIPVPIHIDKRAAADRAEGRRVSEMAAEILRNNVNAVVISDGTKGVDGVLSFQAAKGRNGLEDKDIYVIVTNLAPEKYAELNVLGQWLGMPDIIQLYYQDQIDQAVGRNRGFRQLSADTKTVLVTTRGLWVRLLSKIDGSTGRTALYGVDAAEWSNPLNSKGGTVESNQ